MLAVSARDIGALMRADNSPVPASATFSSGQATARPRRSASAALLRLPLSPAHAGAGRAIDVGSRSGDAEGDGKPACIKTKLSAGTLAYRHALEDDEAWSIPKSEINQAEDLEQAARREFAEELGPAASIGPLRPLGEIRQRGGKRVIAFSGKGVFDAKLSSNTFEMQWPPRSGRLQSFPEVDRAEWFDIETAKSKVLSG